MGPLIIVGKATSVAKKTKKTTKKKSTKKAVAAKGKVAAKTAKKKTTRKKSTIKKAVTRTAKKKVQKKTAKKKTAVKKKVTKKKTAKTKKTVKKMAVKKTAVKKKTAKRKIRSGGLTKAEMEEFRKLLLEKRAELIGDVNYIENESLRKSRGDSSGDLSSMPIHMADIGTDNFEQEFSLGLMDSERKILKEIMAALNRIDEGTFGICEGTDQPISKARLRANPWARYGIKYATMVEQGRVIEGDKIYEEEPEDEGFGDLEDSGEFEIIDDDDVEELHLHDPEDTQYGIFSEPDDD